MKRALAVSLLSLALCGTALALADDPTHEVLVSNTTPTKMNATTAHRGFALQNNGPNTLWCALGAARANAAAYTSKSISVPAGAFLSIPSSRNMYCIAATAAQVTTAATVVFEW